MQYVLCIRTKTILRRQRQHLALKYLPYISHLQFFSIHFFMARTATGVRFRLILTQTVTAFITRLSVLKVCKVQGYADITLEQKAYTIIFEKIILSASIYPPRNVTAE